MDILSDISSVSTHDSMPPLIDRFGNVVVEDDQSTVTLEEGELLPPNSHLFFDDDGNECSYEEYRERMRLEEEQVDEEVWIRTPRINQPFVLKHPRVILAFLRFIDFYNELADPEEVFMMPAMPQRLVQRIREHPGVAQVPPEFQEEVNELLSRLEYHMDLSELPVD